MKACESRINQKYFRNAASALNMKKVANELDELKNCNEVYKSKGFTEEENDLLEIDNIIVQISIYIAICSFICLFLFPLNNTDNLHVL